MVGAVGGGDHVVGRVAAAIAPWGAGSGARVGCGVGGEGGSALGLWGGEVRCCGPGLEGGSLALAERCGGCGRMRRVREGVGGWSEDAVVGANA